MIPRWAGTPLNTPLSQRKREAHVPLKIILRTLIRNVSRFLDWRKGLKNLGLSKWIKHKSFISSLSALPTGPGGSCSSLRGYFLRSRMLIDRKCTRCFSFCFIFRVLWFHFLTDFQEGGGGRFDPAKHFPFFFSTFLKWKYRKGRFWQR